jgi:hypothetical protein
MANGSALLDAIRLRAYFLWEKAGRPDGGDMAYWEQARQEIEREREQASSLASEG